MVESESSKQLEVGVAEDWQRLLAVSLREKRLLETLQADWNCVPPWKRGEDEGDVADMDDLPHRDLEEWEGLYLYTSLEGCAPNG